MEEGSRAMRFLTMGSEELESRAVLSTREAASHMEPSV